MGAIDYADNPRVTGTGGQTVFSLTVQAENGPGVCLVARFTHFERSVQRDRALVPHVVDSDQSL
jgi:hypothetical protein